MTLMELLDVVVIMGVLLAIAVPSYMGMKDRSNQSVAKANLRNALPAVVLYGADNQPNGQYDPDGISGDVGYENMTPNLLQSKYDPTLDPTKYAVSSPTSSSYCIYTWHDAWTAAKAGPSAPITVTLNSSFNPATCS
jgi:type II secretory pathway pseudopilin PulG